MERGSHTIALQKGQKKKYSKSTLLFPFDLLPVVPLAKPNLNQKEKVPIV